MKNRFKLAIAALILIFAATACTPQESDDYSLGLLPQDSQLAFTATPSAAKANVIELKNESQVPGVVTWDLGNGVMAKGQRVEANYPFKGEYVISMTLYVPAGTVTITKSVSIATDDMSLLDTPMYNSLTGGSANLEGKTWVFNQYYAGHFGVFPTDNSWSWNAGPDEKNQSSLYTQEFTFIQVGVKMIWKNNGSVYTNKAGATSLAALGYTEAVEPPAGDFDVKYTPKDVYTFTLNETDKTITLSDRAFFGHYAGTSTYAITKLTDDVLELTCVSSVENGNNWKYVFVPKAKNVKPIVPVRAVPLKEDFEEVKLSVDFKREFMGKLDSIYANPAPVPVNQSKRVYLYEKTASFSSNISYLAKGYKFDLTEVNKIRMKVFIPSYNDYTTVYDKADWGTVAQLQKQVVVKLQNSELGDNAWSTSKEVIKANLATDKWLELEFDFSDVKDRQDLDKIIIQFGVEGHAGLGLFFFDDFGFDK